MTDRKLGVSDFAFSADSARAVFIAAVPDEGRYGTVDGVPDTLKRLVEGTA